MGVKSVTGNLRKEEVLAVFVTILSFVLIFGGLARFSWEVGEKLLGGFLAPHVAVITLVSLLALLCKGIRVFSQ